MNAVLDLTEDALPISLEASLGGYVEVLKEACITTNPVYGLRWYGERYREVSSSPDWFAQSMVENASVEGDGARKLWKLSGQCTDAEMSEKLRLHAIDESRHARYYVFLLDTVFPGSVSAEERSVLDGMSPNFSRRMTPEHRGGMDRPKLIDDLIQINIGEIRTRIHQLLLQPVALAYCEPERRGQVQKILNRLVRDEGKHIAYTAEVISRECEVGEASTVASLMIERMREFNRITMRELGVDKFDGG